MSKSGHSVFPRQRRSIDVLGARIHPVVTDSGTAITRRGTSMVLQHKLGVGDRQARRAMALYELEDWPAPNSGLNAPFGLVNSVSARIQSHSARTRESRIENGRRGGRPRKPAWDVTAGSTCLANQTIVETGAVEPQDHRLGDMWRL